MSEQPDSLGDVPGWDTADRMRKALRTSGVGAQEIADYLGVSRQSVGNWINGRVDPSKQTLRLWALRCGVSFHWLCHGDPVPCGPEGTRIVAGQSAVRRTGSSATYSPLTVIRPFSRQYRDRFSFPLEIPVAA